MPWLCSRLDSMNRLKLCIFLHRELIQQSFVLVHKFPFHKNQQIILITKPAPQILSVTSFFFISMAQRSWSDLPRDLIDRIFRRHMKIGGKGIEPKDLARCSLVCTTWRGVIGNTIFEFSLLLRFSWIIRWLYLLAL